LSTFFTVVQLVHHHLMLAAGPTPPAPPAPPATAVSLTGDGVTGWLKKNVVPLAVFVVGLGLFGRAHKGDTSGTFTRAGLLCIVFVVLAIAANATLGLNIGSWILSLFGVTSS